MNSQQPGHNPFIKQPEPRLLTLRSPAPFPLRAPRVWREWVLKLLPHELHQLFFVSGSPWEELRRILPLLPVRGDPGAFDGPV